MQTLVQARAATTGTADFLLQAPHVTRTRRMHQITSAALNILLDRAYSHYSANVESSIDFGAWCDQRKQSCPHFLYWATALELELCVAVYVRSLREANFAMYLDSLTE